MFALLWLLLRFWVWGRYRRDLSTLHYLVRFSPLLFCRILDSSFAWQKCLAKARIFMPKCKYFYHLLKTALCLFSKKTERLYKETSALSLYFASRKTFAILRFSIG